MRRRTFLKDMGIAGALLSIPLTLNTCATLEEVSFEDTLEAPYHDEEQGFESDLYEEWELDLIMN